MNRPDPDADPTALRPPAAVRVAAPARLHLGFLDPSGSLGRSWGSVGLVIEGLPTAVEIAAAGRDEFVAADALSAELDRAAQHVAALRRHTGRSAPLRLTLVSAPPGHAGFGSGTQLALAVGRAFARRHGLAPSTVEIARWLGRGLRSGVGIAGFDQGGLLVDGGPGADGRPAPLVARVEIPADWRIVLVLDPTRRGLAGNDERRALATLPPLARAAAADLCHQVLMRVLPGAACGDFEAFAAGVTALQQRLGEYFAPAQDASAWTSPAVGRAMAWIAEAWGDTGVALGQSSWGPTGFAVLPSAADAERLLARARSARAFDPALAVRVVAARNRGATIEDVRT